MPLVTITGTLTDAGGEVVPASLQPRLWAVPERAYFSELGVLTDDEILCALAGDGKSFTVQVDSTPGVRWSLWLDRLVPGQETEPAERRARSRVQWSDWFFPDIGGPISDLVRHQHGVGLVVVDESVPDAALGPYQLQYNPLTADLYERVVVW